MWWPRPQSFPPEKEANHIFCLFLLRSKFTWSCIVDRLKVSLKPIWVVFVSFFSTVESWGKRGCKMVMMELVIYHEVHWQAEDDWENDAGRWEPGRWVHPPGGSCYAVYADNCDNNYDENLSKRTSCGSGRGGGRRQNSAQEWLTLSSGRLQLWSSEYRVINKSIFEVSDR